MGGSIVLLALIILILKIMTICFTKLFSSPVGAFHYVPFPSYSIWFINFVFHHILVPYDSILSERKGIHHYISLYIWETGRRCLCLWYFSVNSYMLIDNVTHFTGFESIWIVCRRTFPVCGLLANASVSTNLR